MSKSVVPIGRDILMKGALWRVGNRENVDVWEDSWTPGCDDHK